MGYHISVWEGETPTDHDHAHRIWTQLFAAAHPRVSPNNRLLAFVRSLEREWPHEFADDSPWKYLPVKNDVAGATFETAIAFGSASTAVPRIAALAEEQGLVFWDPQHASMRVPFRSSWERR